MIEIALPAVLICIVLVVLVQHVSQSPQINEGQWSYSGRGNKTMLYQGYRYTVFPSDGGWKFCESPIGEDDPYYSEVYASELECVDAVAIWISEQ